MNNKIARARIKELIYQLKRKVFPGMKRVIVSFNTSKADYFMVTLDIPFLPAWITVHKSVFKMNESAILGCIMHELVHIAFPKIKEEREIDKKVVELGYAKELYELVKFHDSKREKYTKGDGLTKRELQKILKQQTRI